MAMTAAEHFEKAEELLEEAEGLKIEYKAAWAARAQAHLDAARLLLDIEVSMEGHGCTPGTAAYRAGLDAIAEKRRTH
jgi:hypothetical protein